MHQRKSHTGPVTGSLSGTDTELYCPISKHTGHNKGTRTGSIVACTILDPARVPSTEDGGDEARAAIDFVGGELLLEEVEVEEKGKAWDSVQCQIHAKRNAQQGRHIGGRRRLRLGRVGLQDQLGDREQ